MLKIASFLALVLAAFSADQSFSEIDHQRQRIDPGTKAVVSFFYPVIQAWGRSGVRVSTNKAEFNTAAPSMWKMEHAEESYIQVIVAFSEADLVKNWYFNVKECCSIGTPYDDPWLRKERELKDHAYFRPPAFLNPYT